MITMKPNRRKRTALILLSALLCMASMATGVSQTENEPPHTLTLADLCDPIYEGRGAGSEGNRLFAEMLAKRLERFGLEPLKNQPRFLHDFDQRVLVPRETELTAVFDDSTTEELVYGTDFLFTGGNIPIVGTFPIVSIDNEADSASVVLYDRSADETMPVHGAYAATIAIADDFLFASSGMKEDENSSWPPLVNILRPAYERIRNAEALTIKYTFDTPFISLYNAVGVMPGKDRTKAVLLSAHTDGAVNVTDSGFQGALDNASGVLVLDKVTQRMAGTVPPYDVIIAFINAEECGFTGALDLSGRLTGLYEAVYNINVDCVGFPGYPFSMNNLSGRSTALYTQMGAYLSRNGFTIDWDNCPRGDHDTFEMAGIPAVALQIVGRGIIHTIHDTPERIDESIIESVAEMIAAFITENPELHADLEACGEQDNDEHDHGGGFAAEDTPVLAYNEAMIWGDTLYMGSRRWITYAEAMAHHPDLPLPQVFRDCSLQACMIPLYMLIDLEPGLIADVSCHPDNIQDIYALYSDGNSSYRIVFQSAAAVDGVIRRASEGGFIIIGDDGVTINGIGLKQSGCSLDVYDGATSGMPFEINAGVYVNMVHNGTSKVTQENAAALLREPDITGLFNALIGYIQK